MGGEARAVPQVCGFDKYNRTNSKALIDTVTRGWKTNAPANATRMKTGAIVCDLM